jgi:hypothetical protein
MDRTLHQITAIRRMRVCLLLPLLLILSQQGAWLHELSHAVYAANPHQVIVQQGQNSPENGICPSCQSFGQLGAAPLLQYCPQSEPQYLSPSRQLPAPRNRGPPLQA